MLILTEPGGFTRGAKLFFSFLFHRPSVEMAGKATKTPTTYSSSLTTNKTKGPCFNDNWIRPDGRGLHQCRPAFFRTGTVNSASGSSYAEFGNTIVVASVFGPRESKKAMMYSNIGRGRLNCNVSHATFATLEREQGSNHPEYSMMLYKALEGATILESFPKTTVDVFALVLESGGSKFRVMFFQFEPSVY